MASACLWKYVYAMQGEDLVLFMHLSPRCAALAAALAGWMILGLRLEQEIRLTTI